MSVEARQLAGEPRRGDGLRALLLDDDKYALEFLRALLIDRYPGLEVEARLKPDPEGAFDLYFLDDDFDGIRLAGKLARRIRARRPGAVILAFSASLDADTLKDLVAAGCNGVCDKKVASDVPDMLRALDRCIDELGTRGGPDAPASRGYLLRTFRDLFRQWNRRLERQE